MTDLFAASGASSQSGSTQQPLAEVLRPKTLGDVIGQPHLTDEAQGQLYQLRRQSPLPSLILWGPPGCGKTTIARLFVPDNAQYRFEQISAIFSGVQFSLQ